MSQEIKNRKKPDPTKTPSTLEEKKDNKPDSSKSQSLLQKMAIRTFFGALMVFAFAIVLYIGHDLLIFLMLLLQIYSWKEIVSIRFKLVKVNHEKNIWGFRSLQWFSLFLSFYYFYAEQALEYYKPLVPFEISSFISKYQRVFAFTLYIVGFLGLIFSLRKESLKYQFSLVSWTLMSLLIVMGQSHFVVHNALQGLIWVILPHSLTIMNDIMAYFCGVAIGRKFVNKPLTALSENKTWEGFFGGFFFTMIFGFFFPIALSKYEWLTCPKTRYGDIIIGCTPNPVFLPAVYSVPSFLVSILGETVTLLPIQIHGLIFALFASLIAPFGGILASGIKRAYGIKDYNQLIPGHGGITDRFDCQFIVATFVFVYYTTFISNIGSSDYIISQFSLLSKDEQLNVINVLRQIVVNQTK